MIKKKTSMSSFDVLAVVNEIAKKLRGSRLNNIYLFGQRGVLLRFKGGGLDARVVAVPEERIHITSYDASAKGMPPPFIMALRKHIRGALLSSVKQLGFDRIVELGFERGGASAGSLVVELLPRGVIALLSPEGRILQTSAPRQMKDRVVKRGEVYTPPPGGPKRPSELSLEDLKRVLDGCEREAVRCLSRGLGYPGEVVEEALLRRGLNPGSEPGAAAGMAEALLDELRGIEAEAAEALHGYIVYSGDAPLTALAFKPRGLAEAYGLRVVELGSVSEAFDRYFTELARREQEEKLARELEERRARLLASLRMAQESLRENLEKAERLEKLAELLASNMDKLYEAVECARSVRERNGWDYIAGNCPGVVDVKPSQGKIVVSIGGRLVEIDIRADPSRMLVELYKRVGELRAKAERGRKAVEEVMRKIRELEQEASKARLVARASLRRRLWFERYHWIITSNKFLAVAGRNADQNESIVKRYLNEHRIFMHADVHGAPIVVVFAEGKEPPPEDLREAALLTAAYSKAWKAGVGSVDVYWVWGSQVSKSPPPGEYIVKGSFMVYGKRNYIRGVKLELALGVGFEDETPVIVVGPRGLVARRTSVYAILVPGDEDPSSLAKRLKGLFREKLESSQAPLVSALEVEEIRERLPGRSRLIGVWRGEASEPPRPIGGVSRKEDEES